MEGAGEGVDEAAVRSGLGDVDEGERVVRPLGHRYVLAAGASLGVRVEEDAVACDDAGQLFEEAGLTAVHPSLLGFWQLEQVHPYFLAELDCIVMSPRFAAEVAPDWTPTPDHEHDDHRWVSADRVRTDFIWPGQKHACQEILEELVRPGSLAAEHLRIPLDELP